MCKGRVSFSVLLVISWLLFSSGFMVEKSLYSTFTLMINGVQEPVGEIRIAVFDSENRFLEKPRYAEIVPVVNPIIEWQLKDLAYGQYAIAVYHDKNKNGKLDTNILGIPLEQYGFSNNARGKFGPASWSEAKFTVKARSAVHHIQLK
tara:strand:- start:23 stop:466 length:444 start_codon:yes stop_codon:yes gene_type:complete